MEDQRFGLILTGNADDSKAELCGEEGVDEGFMIPINCGLGVQLD